MKKILKNLSHVQIIALGFMLLILVGALLLQLPFSSADGTPPPFLDCLFTATSASCVTGLVTVDTGVTWSLFGQFVLITLIQIGGLGFMTIATLFFIVLRKRMGLREREVMSESINSSKIGGIRRVAGHILIITFAVEGIGALILTLRFFIAYHFPFGKALWFGVFHAVSAFCNAGFDINGNFDSFTQYASDPVIIITLMSLILLGGLGFFVWEEIRQKGFRMKKYSLHAKIVLTVSAILLIFPTLLFYFTEADASHTGMNTQQAILASFFDSVSPRTAGMNITDTSSLSPAGHLMTVILMFIGGSPSSTAGGIKTTTLAVLILFSVASMQKSRSVGCFGRQIPEDSFKKAVCVFFVNLSLALSGFFIIAAIQPNLNASHLIFEVFSAMGTVGMTCGITRDLETISKLVIICLMFCGRVGSISFGSALMEKKSPPPILFPHESITIG